MNSDGTRNKVDSDEVQGLVATIHKLDAENVALRAELARKTEALESARDMLIDLREGSSVCAYCEELTTACNCELMRVIRDDVSPALADSPKAGGQWAGIAERIQAEIDRIGPIDDASCTAGRPPKAGGPKPDWLDALIENSTGVPDMHDPPDTSPREPDPFPFKEEAWRFIDEWDWDVRDEFTPRDKGHRALAALLREVHNAAVGRVMQAMRDDPQIVDDDESVLRGLLLDDAASCRIR